MDRSLTVQDPLAATPRLRDELVMARQEFAGQPCFVIEDPLCGRFFRVGMAEYEFLKQLDGQTTVSDAIGRAAASMGPEALGPQEGLAVCRWLAESGLLALSTANSDQAKPLWQRFNPLMIKIPLFDPHRCLTAALPWFGWLFSRGFLLFWSIVSLYAVALAALHFTELSITARAVMDPDNWWRMFAVWLGLKLIHESAHGLACTRYGGQVTRGGVMLILLAPVAYVEVTSSWRFGCKWQRIITAAAGMYVELFLAALAVIAWTQLHEGTLRRLCFDMALMASAGTLLVNANPLMRFDGYFILSDLAGIPNLFSCGQRYLFSRFKRLIGLPDTLPDWPRRSRVIIAVYAVAALVWRSFVGLAICLGLISFLSYTGGVLAAVLLFWRAGPQAWQGLRRLRQESIGQRHAMLRLGIVAGATCGLLLAMGAWSLRPAWISAPAIVEYAPLTVLRAASPGFVEQVLVSSGELVVQRQPLVVLRNDELRVELAELTLAIEQSRLRARVHQQADELAKCQAELANCEGLQTKQAEIQRRVDSLTILAPANGRLVGRSLDCLVGQYLETGAEIAVLGDEASKELLVAVGQDDFELFHRQLAKSVRIAAGDSRRLRLDASLTRLEPRATQEPPHAALLATAGGPLPAMPRPEESGDDDKLPAYQLLTPCFTGRITLAPAESRMLSCGQLLSIGFRCESETLAAHYLRTLEAWLRAKLASR